MNAGHGDDEPREVPVEEHDQDQESDSVFEPTERAFTCVACGFSTTTDVPPLQYEVHSVCANCGDWTTQLADQDEVIETVKNIAASIEGPTITERQALAYLLRELLGMERQPTADVMETSPSNVDNLLRKAVEKLEDAERVLTTLDTIQDSEEESTG